MQNNIKTIRTQHEVIHARVAGLLNVMNRWTTEVEMEQDERQRVSYMIKRVTKILEEDKPDKRRAVLDENSLQDSPINSGCEFYDIDQNRVRCALGCSMYQCSKNCGYATNVPGSMPPYKTKYMRGRL